MDDDALDTALYGDGTFKLDYEPWNEGLMLRGNQSSYNVRAPVDAIYGTSQRPCERNPLQPGAYGAHGDDYAANQRPGAGLGLGMFAGATPYGSVAPMPRSMYGEIRDAPSEARSVYESMTNSPRRESMARGTRHEMPHGAIAPREPRPTLGMPTNCQIRSNTGPDPRLSVDFRGGQTTYPMEPPAREGFSAGGLIPADPSLRIILFFIMFVLLAMVVGNFGRPHYMMMVAPGPVRAAVSPPVSPAGVAPASLPAVAPASSPVAAS